MIVVEVLAGVLGLGVVWVASGLRVVRQWERAVVFRFGKVQHDVRGPGLTRITPVRDRLRKVNMQIVTMPVPAQDGITRDNVTVRVDAVVYFRVDRPGHGDRRRAELPVRRRAGRADVAAVDHRQERARRPAVQPGEAQPGPGAADRQPGAGLGHPHRPGRDQGRRAAGVDEAVDVAAGRGGAGAAGAGHHRRRASCRRRGSCRRRRRSWPTTRPPCSCGCWRRWCRWRPRRTRPWSCRSRWSCLRFLERSTPAEPSAAELPGRPLEPAAADLPAPNRPPRTCPTADLPRSADLPAADLPAADLPGPDLPAPDLPGPDLSAPEPAANASLPTRRADAVPPTPA